MKTKTKFQMSQCSYGNNGPTRPQTGFLFSSQSVQLHSFLHLHVSGPTLTFWKVQQYRHLLGVASPGGQMHRRPSKPVKSVSLSASFHQQSEEASPQYCGHVAS